MTAIIQSPNRGPYRRQARSSRAPRLGPIDQYIGDRIAAMRLKAGMTLDQLGASIGVSSQQVHKYEMATNRVSVARLLEIAEALDTNVLDFLPAKYR